MTMSAEPVLLLLRRYHTPLRNTPGVLVPLPSQSPKTGTSPGSPYWKTMSATPAVATFLRYQKPDRNTAGFGAAEPTCVAAPAQRAPAPTRRPPPKIRDTITATMAELPAGTQRLIRAVSWDDEKVLVLM